jgi:hypothetical protein
MAQVLCFTVDKVGKFMPDSVGYASADKRVTVPDSILGNPDKIRGFKELQRKQGIGELWVLDSSGKYDYCLVCLDPRIDGDMERLLTLC